MTITYKVISRQNALIEQYLFGNIFKENVMNSNFSNQIKGRFKYASLSLALLMGFCTTANAAVEKLTVSGNQVLAAGVSKSFAGPSLFWSNTGWGGW